MQIQNCMVGKTEIINKNGDAETIKDVLEHTYEGTMLTIKSLHFLFPFQLLLYIQSMQFKTKQKEPIIALLKID